MNRISEILKNLSEIEGIQMTHMPNGAHFEFIKNVTERVTAETALLANEKVKKAV